MNPRLQGHNLNMTTPPFPLFLSGCCATQKVGPALRDSCRGLWFQHSCQEGAFTLALKYQSFLWKPPPLVLQLPKATQNLSVLGKMTPSPSPLTPHRFFSVLFSKEAFWLTMGTFKLDSQSLPLIPCSESPAWKRCFQ